MAKKSKTQKSSTGTIALNKRAKFEYHLDQRIEAGLVLTGWEIKSIRDSLPSTHLTPSGSGCIYVFFI